MAINIAQSDLTKLARALVNPDKEVRDQIFSSLTSFLSQVSTFSDIEMLKLWKALYYCMWLADRSVVQVEIATFFSELVDYIGNTKTIIQFYKMFYRTILREWPMLDQHRLDKFYKLLRFMLRKTFQYLHERNFPPKLTTKLLNVLQNEVFTKTPNGVRFHLFDIFLPELYTATNGKLSNDKMMLLLHSLAIVMSQTKDNACYERISKKIFNNYLTNYCTENKTTNDSSLASKTVFENVKLTAIQSMLFTIASDPSTLDTNRPNIYSLHKQYSIQTGIAFVVEEKKRKEHPVDQSSKTEKGAITSPGVNDNSNDDDDYRNGIPKRKKKYVENSEESVKDESKVEKHIDSEVNNINRGNNGHKRNGKMNQNGNQNHDELVTKEFEIHVNMEEKKEKEKDSSLKIRQDTNNLVDSSSISKKDKKINILKEIVYTNQKFIPSYRFKQGIPGYVYKQGKKGLGYYVDGYEQRKLLQLDANNIKDSQSFQTMSKPLSSSSSSSSKLSAADQDATKSVNKSSLLSITKSTSTLTSNVTSSPNLKNKTPSPASKDKSSSSPRKRVSFGKNRMKDYISSITALQTSTPVAALKEIDSNCGPKPVLKK